MPASPETNSTIQIATPAREISEDLIGNLVEAFYGRVLQDPELGPIFRMRLDGQWDEHLAKMVDFWSSVLLRTGRYHGRPHVAHAALGLTPDLFHRWLGFFEATAVELCAPDAAALLIDRARRIAESLQIGLGIGSKSLPGIMR